MDPIRLGLALRALRIRRGWRQQDLADRVGLSRSAVSDVECGACSGVTVGTLDRIVAVLGARLDVGVRWHGEQLDRLLDAAHAGLVEQSVRMLARDAWEVLVEASFAIFGERGSIDILAFHPRTGHLLVVEVKSVVPDCQATLHALDRKVRLAPRIAAERGWIVRGEVARLLVVGEGTTARRRVALLAATYEAALPVRGSAVKAWLRCPDVRIAALLFLPFASEDGLRTRPTGIQRVRGPRRSAIGPVSSSSAQQRTRMTPFGVE